MADEKIYVILNIICNGHKDWDELELPANGRVELIYAFVRQTTGWPDLLIRVKRHGNLLHRSQELSVLLKVTNRLVVNATCGQRKVSKPPPAAAWVENTDGVLQLHCSKCKGFVNHKAAGSALTCVQCNKKSLLAPKRIWLCRVNLILPLSMVFLLPLSSDCLTDIRFSLAI